MIREKEIKGLPGWLMLFLLLALIILSIAMLVHAIGAEEPIPILAWIIALVVASVCVFGLTVVNPNQAVVVQLFGTYQGSLKQQGLCWVNPFTTRRTVSLRVRNFESSKLKVNDQDRQPDRNRRGGGLARRRYGRGRVPGGRLRALRPRAERVGRAQPGDDVSLRRPRGWQMSLRGSAVRDRRSKMRDEIQERLAKAGVEVIEARISHLAYAPEIASAMLRRQQATAIIAARQKIVEGAVGMVEMALEQLSAKHVVELDEERKASMVSNLLVVLCSDRDAQPSSTPARSINRASRMAHTDASHFCYGWTRRCTTALERWAAEDLRSLNAQIEFLLRRALKEAGRLRAGEAEPAPAPEE